MRLPSDFSLINFKVPGIESSGNEKITAKRITSANADSANVNSSKVNSVITIFNNAKKVTNGRYLYKEITKEIAGQ